MERRFSASLVLEAWVLKRTPIVSVAPLCTIPLWNNPLAEGAVISVSTLAPPPDCPKTVTFSGSPPKASMFSWTHWSAATISVIPTLAES